MDLLDSIWKAPLWLKVDLALVQAAALYTAIKILLPILAWLHMTISKFRRYIRNMRYGLVWARHKPSVQLVEEPLPITSVKGENSDVWSTSCKLKFQNTDKSNTTEIKLSQIGMNVKQGWGIRLRKVVLGVDSEKTKRSLELQPKSTMVDTGEVIIYFQRMVAHSELSNLIEIGKPCKWEIYDISAKIHPLSYRNLRSLKGEWKLN